MSGSARAAAEELLEQLRRRFAEQSSYFAERYVAGSASTSGDVTVIYSAGNGRHMFGRSWNVTELQSAFTPYEAEDMADILYVEDIDGPSGLGRVDVARAAGLVEDPDQVRWVDDHHDVPRQDPAPSAEPTSTSYVGSWTRLR